MAQQGRSRHATCRTHNQPPHKAFGEVLFWEVPAKSFAPPPVPPIVASKRTLQGLHAPPLPRSVDPLQAHDPWQAAIESRKGSQKGNASSSSGNSDALRSLETSILHMSVPRQLDPQLPISRRPFWLRSIPALLRSPISSVRDSSKSRTECRRFPQRLTPRSPL